MDKRIREGVLGIGDACDKLVQVRTLFVLYGLELPAGERSVDLDVAIRRVDKALDALLSAISYAMPDVWESLDDKVVSALNMRAACIGSTMRDLLSDSKIG